jgi:hypothetical protein
MLNVLIFIKAAIINNLNFMLFLYTMNVEKTVYIFLFRMFYIFNK